MPLLVLFFAGVLVACDSSNTPILSTTLTPTVSVVALGGETPQSSVQAQASNTLTAPSTTVLTGFTPSPQPNTQATLPNTPAPTLSTLDIATAWGKNIASYAVSNVMPDNTHVLVYETVTPDAKFIVGQVNSRTFGAEAGKVVLLDVASQQVTILQQLTSPDAQIVGSAADANWVVWSVATQQPNFGDWTLYSYNLQSHAFATVAKAPTAIDGSIVPGPLLLPKVDHGVLVWAEGSTNTSPTVKIPTVVKSYNLMTQKQDVLASNALSPAISWPNIAWVQSLNEASAEQKGVLKTSLVVKNLETSTQKTLRYPDTPLYFDIDGNSIMWVDHPGHNMYVTDISDTPPQLIVHTQAEDVIQFPTINNRLITWSSYTTNQVWDRVQNRLIQLSDVRTLVQAGSWQSEMTAHGNAFVWLTVSGTSPDSGKNGSPSSHIYNVVNTAQLPNK